MGYLKTSEPTESYCGKTYPKNIIKLVLNATNTIFYTEDSQIVILNKQKVYDDNTF